MPKSIPIQDCRILLLSVGLALISTNLLASDVSEITYNRDIRPILSENCFVCHGPDSASRKADLRMDRRQAALDSGAIVPQKPNESAMIKRIFSNDPDEQMPPPASHKKLSAAQKEILKRWVASGAEYQPHWSFIAPTKPQPPAVKNEKWVRNPIDRFVLAKLESLGLQPAEEADQRTLARRLSLDLTGLPPSPADVEKFVNDRSANAYEAYVDKLLKSENWGEHRGRYWLDAARYADTHGIHFDNYREMWSYRDWVIKAFNRNLPFDQFTIEQLAGDLLPNRTVDQHVATGFNRCNITTNEGGSIAEEYLVLYTRDRLETTSQVWMGLTAACSTCHDHKFDPLSQREFYELAAFFNNTTQNAMDGNIRDTPPILSLYHPDDQQRADALAGEINAAKQKSEERRKAARPEFDKWFATAAVESVAKSLPTEGLRLRVPLNEGTGETIHYSQDGEEKELSVGKPLAWEAGYLSTKGLKVSPGAILEFPDAGDFDAQEAFSCSAWIKITKNDNAGAIVARMENENKNYRGWDLWIEKGRPGMHLIHRWPDDALKVVAKQPLKLGQWSHVLVNYDGSGKASGISLFVNGVRQDTTISSQTFQGKNTTRTSVPLKIGQRHTADPLEGLHLEDLRLYGRNLSSREVEQITRSGKAMKLVAKAANHPPGASPVLPAAELTELTEWWLVSHDQPYQQLSEHISALEKEQAALKARSSVALVMQEKPAEAMAYVLFRGEYDKRRDAVKPATPAFLPPLDDALPRNRLGLARWLLQPEHPLTARVTVNRFWQEVFGTGLVRTAGDFGIAGELPSHQEMLDWLAVEFRESGWDMKRFFKMLVTSATYRQAATVTPLKLEKDPQNRWLSRGPRFRMDAEMIRDYALAASGLYINKIGGPSVKPYQPDGVWEAVAMIGSNTRDYKRDTGENLYRRSLYTFWKRSAPPASLDIFNAPSRETCTVRRERTNTPLQALVTLNDPQYVEAARHLAQTALKVGGEKDEDRLHFVAQRLLARPFRSEELIVVRQSLADLVAFYAAHADDAKALLNVGEFKADESLPPVTLAAWTMLANELLNLDEVLTK